MINRKGASSGSSIYFFFFILILGFILLGVVISTYLFYGSDYSFYSQESGVLFGKVVKCLNKEGFFESSEEMAFKCRFDMEVLSEEHLIYIKEVDSGKEISLGDEGFLVTCDLDIKTKSNKPSCLREIYGDYEIVVGSNQKSRRIFS